MSEKPVVLKFTVTPKVAADFDEIRSASGDDTTQVDTFRRLIRDEVARQEGRLRDVSSVSLLEQKLDRMLSVCYHIEDNVGTTNVIGQRILNAVYVMYKSIEKGMSLLLQIIVKKYNVAKQEEAELEKSSETRATQKIYEFDFVVRKKKTRDVIADLKGKPEYKWATDPKELTSGQLCYNYTNGKVDILSVIEESGPEKAGQTETRYRPAIIVDGFYREFKKTFVTLKDGQEYVEPFKAELIRYCTD